MSSRSIKKSDTVAPHEKELVEYVNNRKEDLLLMATYYANAKFAYQCKATDVDSTGITIQYVDKNFEGDLVQKDVRIQFETPATNKEFARERILKLIKEARVALGLDIDKSYIPPGREPPKLFFYPSSTMMQIISILWALAIFMALPFRLPLRLELWRFKAGGPEQFQLMLFAALIMHLVESLAVIGIGIWTKFPRKELVKWWVMVIPFGVAALGPFVKTAAKRKFAEDAKSKDVKIQ